LYGVNVVAIALVAGRESLISVRGEALVAHTVRALLRAECVERVVVVVAPEHGERARTCLDAFGPAVLVVAGSADHADALRVGLAEALRLVPEADAVLLQDPSRAFAPVSVIRDLVRAVEQGASAAVPVLPVTDTIKQVDTAGDLCATVDRSGLRKVQGPRIFALDVLRAACESGDTDGDILDRLEKPVTTVPGHVHAVRISSEFDRVVAIALDGDPS
jgi:2-C-methyl-D-erythritol 4-phosphate cytidylyltransferase